MSDQDLVSDNNANGNDQWKSEEFRGKIRSQIQEVMNLTDVPVPKTSAELEEQIFSKATKREEYLSLAARIIVHIRDLKTKAAPPPVIEAEKSATVIEES